MAQLRLQTNKSYSVNSDSNRSNWGTYLSPGHGIPYYVLKEEFSFQDTDARQPIRIVLHYTTMSDKFVDLNYLPFFKQKIHDPLNIFLAKCADDKATLPAAGKDKQLSFSIVVLFRSENSPPAFLYYIFDNRTLKLHFLDDLRLSEHYFMADVPIWEWQQKAVHRAYRPFLTTALQRLLWEKET